MKGILCLQVGTPDSPAPKDVGRYLTEFLTDPCIIEKPWLSRQLLVRGIIVPRRVKTSSKNYTMVWENRGSPLKIHTEDLMEKLQSVLGQRYFVTYGMGYQNPSIASALKALLQKPLQELIIIPLFPQYARATTGSVLGKTFDLLKQYREIPSIRVISSFETHQAYIQALKETLSPYPLEEYDQVVMSFHGLPERVGLPYKERCLATARALAKEANITKYTVSFQSRLGKEPWILPSTSEVLKRWKKVLVISPSFVADCVETLHELGIEEKEAFLHAGGERLDLVPCLNSSSVWAQALAAISG